MHLAFTLFFVTSLGLLMVKKSPFTNPQLLRQLEPMDLREPLRLLMALPPSVKVLEFFRTLSILVGLWLLPLGSSYPPSGTPGAAWSIARAGELRPLTLEHFQASGASGSLPKRF